jgi:hypothetical protein
MRFFSNDPSEPGIFAVGQFVTGIFVLGQFGRGIFVVGQFAVGVFAVGQFAVGLLWAFGQFSVAARAHSFMGSLSLVPKFRWPWEPNQIPPHYPLFDLYQEKSRFAWGRATLNTNAEFESAGKKFQVEYANEGLAAEVKKAASNGVTEGVVHVKDITQKTIEEAGTYRETPKTEDIVQIDRFVPIQKIWRGAFLHPNKDNEPIGLAHGLIRLSLFVPFVYVLWQLALGPALGL